MRGSSLVTVMVLLSLLSASALYGARESLLAMRNAHLEKDAFVLEAMIEQALLVAEQWIQHMPAGTSMILPKQEPNFYLEKPVSWYLANNPGIIRFSLPNEVAMAMVFEDLGDLYLRGTILLMTSDKGVILRMQTTWNQSTLNPKRLGWRRGTA